MKLMKVIAAGLLVMIAAGVILTACDCFRPDHAPDRGGETGRRPVGTEKSRRYGRKKLLYLRLLM